jgi:aspartyl protease family protein
MTEHEIGRLAYLLLLLLAVGGYALAAGRHDIGRNLRLAALWSLIFLGVIAVAGLWPDIRQTIAPRQSAIVIGQQVELPRGPDGHYRATLIVNGAPVDFFVDTGATEVVLSRADAERVGIDTAALDYLGVAMTANGPVRTARVRLAEVSLEGIADRNLAAVVTDGPLEISLLGMSYLHRFSHIEIADGRMILTR